MKAINLLLDFIHLVYPRSCILCDKTLISHEQIFFFKCIHHLKRNSVEQFDSMSVKRKNEKSKSIENKTIILIDNLITRGATI